MIVLCPKSFAGTESEFERGFLKHYLSRKREKAVVANEVWDTWRHNITMRYEENAQILIGHFRGWFEPEAGYQLKEDFTEKDPIHVDTEVMIQKTKELVSRRWADIQYFVTQEPTKYVGLKIKPISLLEFYVACMNSPADREIVLEYSVKSVFDK